MKFTRKIALFALVATLAAATTAFAEPIGFTLDPNHSSAEFRVRHIFTKVPGRFGKVEGKFVLDQKNLANSSVEATIDAASVSTENDRRDSHLKTEDFFWVEKFPSLTFKSTQVVPVDDTHFQVIGNLTIRGVTKQVTLDVEKLGVDNLGQMGTRAGFEATTKINRKDFGIVWNRALDNGGALLGDDVEISLVAEGVHMDEAETASK
jgi:polyisoprenoid-binding protein YceI